MLDYIHFLSIVFIGSLTLPQGIFHYSSKASLYSSEDLQSVGHLCLPQRGLIVRTQSGSIGLCATGSQGDHVFLFTRR